jgi:hypothetical protein
MVEQLQEIDSASTTHTIKVVLYTLSRCVCQPEVECSPRTMAQTTATKWLHLELIGCPSLPSQKGAAKKLLPTGTVLGQPSHGMKMSRDHLVFLMDIWKYGHVVKTVRK